MAVRKMIHDLIIKMDIDPMLLLSIMDGIRVRYFVESGLSLGEFKETQKIITDMYEDYLKYWNKHGMD